MSGCFCCFLRAVQILDLKSQIFANDAFNPQTRNAIFSDLSLGDCRATLISTYINHTYPMNFSTTADRRAVWTFIFLLQIGKVRSAVQSVQALRTPAANRDPET